MAVRQPIEPNYDAYGERVVAIAMCRHCGEGVELVDVFVEPEVQVSRPVQLWKHASDGAVGCGPNEAAAPAGDGGSATR